MFDVWTVTEAAGAVTFTIRLKLYGNNREVIFLTDEEASQLASDLLTLVALRAAKARSRAGEPFTV